MSKTVFVNDTDHEVEHNGYIYPSVNYNPDISSYHRETEHYTLHKEGFADIKVRKIFGKWEMLSYKNPYIGDERWSSLNNFTEQEILNQIALCGLK